MNAVSLLLGARTQATETLKAPTGPATGQSSGELNFVGQLKSAIEERKSESQDPEPGTAGKESKRDAGKKKDEVSVTIVVTPQLPSDAQPGALGLPSLGIEPGQAATAGPPVADSTKAKSTDGESIQASEDASVESVANATTPPSAVKPEPRTELAFALRLADKSAEPAPGVSISIAPVTPQQRTSAISPDQTPSVGTQVETTLLPPLETPRNSSLIETLEPDQAPTATGIDFTAMAKPDTAGSEVSSSPAAQIKDAGRDATPISRPVAITGSLDAKVANPSGKLTNESPGDDHQSESGPSSERQKLAHSQPADNFKPQVFTAVSTSAAQVAPHAPVESNHTFIPGPSAPIPSPAAARVPEPEKTASPAVASDIVMTPPPTRATAASPATDVSVTIPVPRPGSSSEDLVAIRLVQKGPEVHVSVRTPDSQLTQSMRQDLGKLSTGMDQAGFRLEAWRPTASGVATQANTDSHRERSHGDVNQDSNGSGQRSGGQNGRGAKDPRDRPRDDRPRWVAELERQSRQ